MRSSDIGVFMRLTTPLIALRNATSDVWRMHDFNYQLPVDNRQDYWEKEYRPPNKFSLQSLLKTIQIKMLIKTLVRVFFSI